MSAVGPVGVGSSSASRTGLVLIAGCALLLGPPACLAVVVSVCLVADQREQHWHEVAAAAAAVAVVSVALVLVFIGNPIAFTYSGLLGWFGSPSLTLPALFSVWLPMAPLGVPLGFALGACGVGVGESLAVGAEWHPLEVRRQEVDDRRMEQQSAALLADRRSQEALPTPPLGVAREGDLDKWRDGGYAVLDEGYSNLGLMVVGSAGSGKTVTAERLVATLARRGRRVVFADCKGTDPELPERVVAAYIEGARRSDVRVHVFPDEPLNGWVGPPQAVANRLISLQDTSEPYYESTLATAVRLAVGMPSEARGRPCDSSREFLARLNSEDLSAAYRRSEDAAVVAGMRKEGRSLVGTLLRFHGMFAAVAGGFDGTKSWGDSDVVVLKVPYLAAPKDAMAIMRVVLADFSQYCSDPRRKARRGDDITLVIDEYSAISGLAPQVIDLVERLRDVGGQVVVTAQSWQGLGRDDDERCRVQAAMAATILHRCAKPEELLGPVGTERKVEQSWQLDDATHSGMGSMRMGFRMKIDPDHVRQAAVGQAWAIADGRYLHLDVIPNCQGPALAEAQRLVGLSHERGIQTPPPAPQEAREERTYEPPNRDSDWLVELTRFRGHLVAADMVMPQCLFCGASRTLRG